MTVLTLDRNATCTQCTVFIFRRWDCCNKRQSGVRSHHHGSVGSNAAPIRHRTTSHYCPEKRHDATDQQVIAKPVPNLANTRFLVFMEG